MIETCQVRTPASNDEPRAAPARRLPPKKAVQFLEPLTPFERYMLEDDSPDHSMTFYFRLTFSGDLDLSRFRDAWRVVVSSHPLLASTVVQVPGRRPHWSLRKGLTARVFDHWPGDPLSHGDMPHMDIARERGVRAWAASLDGRTELWFQFHHSCCDAIAATRVIEELFAAYRDPDAARLQARSTLEENVRRVRLCRQFGRGTRLTKGGVAKRMQRTVKFVRNKPRPLPVTQPWHLPSSSYPAFHAHTLDGIPQSLQPRRDNELNATINDWLLAALFRAVGGWFRACRETNERACLRVAVPINLRRHADEYRQCVNCVSMVFLDRLLAATNAPDSLLAGISREMREVKRDELGRTMLSVLSTLAACPTAMRRVLASKACASTTVLSNLGVVFSSSGASDDRAERRLGGAVLESIQFLPPIRRGVSAAFGALTYAGRLSYAMHYDPRCFSRDNARRMFDGVLETTDCLQSAMR